jgi:hypothetical protein
MPNQPIHQKLFLQSKKNPAGDKGLKNCKDSQQKRESKKSGNFDDSQKNGSKCTPRNNEILFVRKFIKDFHKVIEKIPCLKNGTDLEMKLDYVITEEILVKMGFLRDSGEASQKKNNTAENERKVLMSKIYDSLNGEIYGGIKKKNLLVFFLALLGVDCEVITSEIAQEEERSFGMNKENEFNQPELINNQKIVNEKYINNTQKKKDDSKAEYFLRSHGTLNTFSAKQHHASCINLSTFSSFDIFNTNNPLIKTTKNRESNNAYKHIIGRFDEKGNWEVRKDDIKEIQRHFEVLKRNRLTTEPLKKTKHNWTSFDFKPKVSETSRQLAVHHRQKVAQDTLYLLESNNIPLAGSMFSKDFSQKERTILFTDLLVLQKNVEKIKHQRIYEEKQRQELNKYPFHPEISSNKLSTAPGRDSTNEMRNKRSLSMSQERLRYLALPKNKKDRKQSEVEFEKFQGECTFAPDLSSTRFRKIIPMAKELISKDLGDALWRIRNQKRDEEQSDANKKYDWNEDEEQAHHHEHATQTEEGSVIFKINFIK